MMVVEAPTPMSNPMDVNRVKIGMQMFIAASAVLPTYTPMNITSAKQ